MFYHEFVLAKKGTLGKVWLAAHWEKKLSRSAIAKHNVVDSCQSIIEPVTPLALRTSGHLLLGVVRIHDGKAKDLLSECSNALYQIKRAFTPGVDTSMAKTTAPHTAITYNENADDGRDELPEFFEDEESRFGGQSNIGRVDEITMPLENDFMDAEYAAPDLDEAFGDEYVADTNVVQNYDEEEIEQGRNMDPEAANLEPYDEPPEVLLDATADTTADFGLAKEDEFVAPIVDEDIPFDTTETREGAFEEAVDPDFGRETPNLSREDEKVENITLSALETSAASTTTPSVVLGRKRKLIVDAKIEISSEVMKAGLQPDGPNDITRQPYSAVRGPLAFGQPVPTKEGMQRRLRNSSAEAPYSRPLTHSGRWKGKLSRVWNRGFATKLSHLPPAEDVDEIEVGRRNPAAEESDFRLGIPDDVAPGPADDLPPFETEELFEPEAPPEIDVTRDDDPSLPHDATIDSTFATDFGDEMPVSRIESRDAEEEEDELQPIEEHESGHMTKRTVGMIGMLRQEFDVTESVSYNDLTRGKSRRVAAQCLYELLILKTKDYVQLEQSAPFADIAVTAAPEILNPA